MPANRGHGEIVALTEGFAKPEICRKSEVCLIDTDAENAQETLMKIEGISDKYSTDGRLAILTNPRLSEIVWTYFLPLYQRTPQGGAVQLTAENGRIVLHTMNPPKGYLEYIERLLTQAEGMAAKGRDSARDQQKIEGGFRREELQRVAESQGRPILL